MLRGCSSSTPLVAESSGTDGSAKSRVSRFPPKAFSSGSDLHLNPLPAPHPDERLGERRGATWLAKQRCGLCGLRSRPGTWSTSCANGSARTTPIRWRPDGGGPRAVVKDEALDALEVVREIDYARRYLKGEPPRSAWDACYWGCVGLREARRLVDPERDHLLAEQLPSFPSPQMASKRKLRMRCRCSCRLTWDFSSSVAGCRGYTMRRGIGIPSSSKALFWVRVGSVS